MIQNESWGEKWWTPNWLHFSVFVPVKEIMLCEGKNAPFFLAEFIFENWKNPYLAQLFQKVQAKIKNETRTVLRQKKTFCCLPR